MHRYCPNCGRKIPVNAVFCPNCGFSLSGNRVSHFQRRPYQRVNGYDASRYYQPQPYGNNYAMGYFPGHPIRRWSFKIISIVVILAMIFCYIVFHLYYQHTMPSDMKGTTISGTKMLSAPAPAKNKNNRNHPRTIIKDYSPTEYFYDEAFFGEYSDNESEFYSTYDNNNEFNYNTVNNASDTFNRNTNTQNNTNSTNSSHKNNGKSNQNQQKNSNSTNKKNSSSVKNAKDKAFMGNAGSHNSTSKSSDSSNDSSDNLSDSSNNSSDSNSDSSNNSSDSSSDSSSNSSDSSSDSSSNSSDSNSSDSNSNNSDSNSSDNNSDSNSDSNNNSSDSNQSYHPSDDGLFLDPLANDSNGGSSGNNGGHRVNAQLSYTIEPHSIVVDMRLGKVQKEVTYNIEHIHRYSNNRVEFTVAGFGKYAKYHSFTFIRGAGNQYEIDAVNGSHVSAEHFNNGQLSITKGSK